jgi:nucleoside-diphosphate-sugar epimerase
MKALITGATGFIGSHLVERLIKKGYEITCITRDTSKPGWLEGLDITFLQGDCSDRDFLSKHVGGHDFIFHLSGLTKSCSKDDFYSVNTKGTENIISVTAQKNPNIRRFIFLSSLSAFGPKVKDSLPTEEQQAYPVSDYGKSKLKAEQIIQNYGDTLPISILRPCAVYGPRDRDLFLLFKCVTRGFLPVWGKGCTSLIYIDDLIDTIMLAAEKNTAVGKTYFISDGRIYPNEEIVREIMSALNANPLKIRLPKAALSIIGIFGERMSKMRGKNTMINRDKMKELRYAEWVCDISKAKNDLFYQPKVELKKGIQWTADWYRIHKWI